MKLQNTLVMAPLGLTVSAIAVQSAHATASAQSRYIITELGTLANAINNRGQVAGTSQVLNTNDYHAFLYTNGRMLDLGTLPGTSSSEAFGINDHGAVCGVSDKVDGEGNVLEQAFVYSNGHIQALVQPPGSLTSWATAINNVA